MSAAAGGVFGAPLKRKEDPRLLRGDGRYVADLKAHGMLAAAIVRSPPPPRLDQVRRRAPQPGADPRTIAVLTAADLPDLPPLPCIDAEETTRPFNQPVIASDKVRYVGEPVAVVVAEDRYVAEDVAELVVVDYEPLPAVTDAEQAMEPGAPIVHEETNLCDTLEYRIGDPDAAFEAAPRVLAERLHDAALRRDADGDARRDRRVGPADREGHADDLDTGPERRQARRMREPGPAREPRARAGP